MLILLIARVDRADQLDHHDFRALLTDRTMSDTLRHNEHVALFQTDVLMRFLHLERHGANEEVKELICVWVGVPDE